MNDSVHLEAESPRQPSHREILVVMSGLMLAMLLAMLDNMIVAPALPTIVGELGGLEHLAWVTTAYILGTAVATPLWGKFGDILDRKTVFVAAILVFLVGSALCGAAPGMTELIAFRALQGVGAGGIVVGVMSAMAVLVPPRDRGRYTGYFMAIMPVSMVGGPLVGGWITDNASWRWAFYVNVPVGAIALFVVAATMKLPKPERRKPTIDWLGAALMVTWITALVLLITWGGSQYAWSSPEILFLIWLSFSAFLVFLIVEGRVPEPILPLRVFRNLNFTLAAALGFVVGFGMFGAMTFLPQFQQYVQGASATASGLLLLPMMVGVILSSTISGQITSRTGHYRAFPVLGTVLLCAGLTLLATMTVETTRTVAGVQMFVVGLGMGLLFSVTMLLAQNSVEIQDIGAATATATFVRSMGGSVGVSILGALYAHRLSGGLDDRLGAANPLGDGTELSPDAARGLPVEVVDALARSITDGIDAVFACAAAVCVVGVVLAAFIRQVPLRGFDAPKAPVGVPVKSELPAAF
ncbi:MAG: MDR family MFS transporter [Sporichthyaceae bacterium]